MPGRRPLLSRGRSASLLLAGALVATFVSGWARRELMTALTGPLLDLPWLPLRRLALGLSLDLPAAAAVALLCAIAGRVLLVTKPGAASLALVAAVWALDALLAWQVLGDLGLWTDPLVLAGRAPMAAAAALGGALALGWRPGSRGAGPEARADPPAGRDAEPGAARGGVRPEGEQNGFDGAGPPG
jgi:hypothetical protein